MKRSSTGALAALVALCCGLTAVAAPTVAQNSAPPNFGSPPSGQYPILFNDHHVYSKPDVLKRGRVLAAIVRGGTILIPLRSMFEQMGASVSYDSGTKSVTVSKPGSEVRVTVGRPEVVINGEARPLDVPPMIYQGTVLVPVRVISEGMGAYVQWVPDRQIVVVRYLPATPAPPPPTEAPTTAPTIVPTPTPAPTPTNEVWLAGDYIFSPKVYNEFSPGNTGTGTWAARGGFEFDAFNIPWMVEGSWEQYVYPHNCSVFAPPASSTDCNVTTVGQTGQTQVPSFTARDNDFDYRLGGRVAKPRIYIGIGYIFRTGNYGYPQQTGFGFGAEKLPDLDRTISPFGNIWYYPNVKGAYTDPGTGIGYTLAYRILKYQIGGTLLLKPTPIFFDFGYMGTSGKNKASAPVDFTANGAFAGLGIRF